MGLFAQQPEEPTDAAALPGEPLRPRTRAEVLPEATRPETALDALMGMPGAAVTSIEVPVTVEAPGEADGE